MCVMTVSFGPGLNSWEALSVSHVCDDCFVRPGFEQLRGSQCESCVWWLFCSALLWTVDFCPFWRTFLFGFLVSSNSCFSLSSCLWLKLKIVLQTLFMSMSSQLMNWNLTFWFSYIFFSFLLNEGYTLRASTSAALPSSKRLFISQTDSTAQQQKDV